MRYARGLLGAVMLMTTAAGLAIALVATHANATTSMGRFRAHVDGEVFVTRLASLAFDEVAKAYAFAACEDDGGRCSRQFFGAFKLPKSGTGPARCNYIEFYSQPTLESPPRGWSSYTGTGGKCSMRVRSVVRDDSGHVQRIKVTFSGIVTPRSGEGPNLTIKGRFRGPVFGGHGA